MAEIRLITDSAGFDALRLEWDTLAGEANGALFQSWEWQRAWWRHLGRGRLFVWTLRRGDRLIALAPLVLRRHLGLALREVALCGTGVSDYLDILCRPEDAEVACERLLDDLLMRRRVWDLIDFQQLRENSPLLQACVPTELRSLTVRQEPCPFVSLPESWEAFAATLGKKLRSNIAYYERLLARSFRLEIETATTETLDAGMDALFQLHHRRWRGRGLPGAFAGSRVRAFHREVAARCAERGWLRLHTLRLDGCIRAVLYCFCHGGSGYYYLGGFEPALGRYSPGTVLTACAIREAIHGGAREFDFLRGDEPYKYTWNATDRWNRRRVMWKPELPSSLTPRVIDLETRIEHRVKEWARSR